MIAATPGPWLSLWIRIPSGDVRECYRRLAEAEEAAAETLAAAYMSQMIDSAASYGPSFPSSQLPGLLQATQAAAHPETPSGHIIF